MARGFGFGLAAALLIGACSSPSKPPPRQVPAAASAPRAVAKAPARPVWQARRVIADAVTTPQGRVHTVKTGETGIAIARAYGVSWDKLITLNGLKPPFILEIGDKLRLPSVRQVAAQTPEERARAFSLDIDDIITGGEPAIGGQIVAATPATPRVQRPTTRRAPPAAPQPLPMPVGDAPVFRWPVEGRIISAFGAKPGGRFNDGVNLKAMAGAPVRAAADGIVAYAGDAIPGFGNLVLIKHAGGWVTAYGHNETLLVARGGKVAAGDVIARAGETGAVTEPQVHFELRRGRTPVDPVRVIGGK